MKACLAVLLHLYTRRQTIALRIDAACDASWGTFGEGTFNATKYNHAVEFRSFENYDDHHYGADHQYGLQGLYVNPAWRFAFCLIEKNGCSTLNRLFNKYVLNDGNAPVDYELSKNSLLQLGYSGFDSVFSDPTATRAVFVRDPLIRFVSAFLDKCVLHLDVTGHACPMYKEKGTVFRDAVEWVLKNNITNPHWIPQSLHCDLRHRVHQYTVIGYMTKNTFARDVSCMLDKAGFSNVYDIGHARDYTYKPADGLTEEDVLKRFFTPEAARDLIRLFQSDYDTFGFEREPEWLTHATGEWYDKGPSLLSSVSLLSLRGMHIAPSTDEEDDIFALASRAGFIGS